MLSGVIVSGIQQDVTIGTAIPHPTEAKEILYVDTDSTYNQSLLPDNKIWTEGVFDNETFYSFEDARAQGFFPDPDEY